MVNKHYTVQHQITKKSPISVSGVKRYSPPPIRNSSIISDTPNPNIVSDPIAIDTKCDNFNNKNLDPIVEEQNPSSFGRNISLYSRGLIDRSSLNCADNKSSDDSQFCFKDLSINDIGRFQYILQMDREMGTHPDTLYRIPSRTQNSSNSSSINSTNHTNFWKSGSESPMTYSTTDSRRRRHEIYRHLKDFWKHSKWPLLLIICCIFFGLLIYFLVINQNSNIEDTHLQLQANVSSKRDIDERINLDKIIQEVKTSTSEDISDLLDDNLKDITEPVNIIDDFGTQKTDTVPIAEQTFPNKTIESTTKVIITTTSTPIRNTQILKIVTQSSQIEDDEKSPTTEKINKDDKTAIPTKETLQVIGFTSGHQNNFGVPIEEDERILKLLNDELIKFGQNDTSTHADRATTDSSVYRTHVSPTLPVVYHGETTTEQIFLKLNTTEEGICKSTSLPICRGVLHYDLTTSSLGRNLTDLELDHFKYLIDSQCSVRAAEFVCSAMEPECRPAQMGILQPCKRICKSILEPCASIIASSEILTMTFDCDSYPDSSDRNVCEDPTRRGKCFESEFKCLDSTCIPLQWKCDNIKDCSLGEDEEDCMFCEHEEFRCHSIDKCIPDKWRCDQYEDCPDGSDEMDCNDYDEGSDGPLDDFLSPRIYSFASIQSPNSPNSRPYLTISGEDRLRDDERDAYEDGGADGFLPTGADNFAYINESDNQTNEALKDDNEEIQTGEASGRVVVGVPRNLANFQDSKEIMMTSDSETDFKYSAANQTSTTTTTTTGRTEETSSVSSETSTFCPENQLRCVSGKCITVGQICDKTIDCPDGADEAMCIYKEN